MKRWRISLPDLKEPFERLPTDARADDGSPRRGEIDPETRARHKRRRHARRLVFYLMFLGGTVAALLGDGGLVDLLRLRGSRAEADVELAAQRARVEAERSAIESLENDPLARERIARERLGLVRPGEMLFLLPREDDGWLDGETPGSGEPLDDRSREIPGE